MLFKRHKTAGHLDAATLQRVTGWASRGGTPERLEVELLINGVLRASARADKFRQDLLDAGIGDGQHGFEIRIPDSDLHPGRNELRVRVKGASTDLTNSPITVEHTEPIEYFAGDIVDNCNLRCPFCLVDYAGIRTTNKMSEDTFRKWIAIMPLVRDGSFFISCLHEATLHPRLFEFIDMIPQPMRRKVFFTTNLCKPLKDEQIAVLAHSRLHHLNVSMDTLDESLFPVLRKGGRLRIFRENLGRLVEAFKASAQAPELRYISMAYRSNLAELPGLVTRAFTELHAARHEVRYTFNVRHITPEFREKHFLSRDDWVALKVALNSLPHTVDVVPPPDDYETALVRSVNYWEMPDEEGFPATVPERPIALRGAWDGEVRIRKREQHFKVNVNILDDPAAFFRAI